MVGGPFGIETKKRKEKTNVWRSEWFLTSELMELLGYFAVHFEIQYYALVGQFRSLPAGWILPLLPEQLLHTMISCTVNNSGQGQISQYHTFPEQLRTRDYENFTGHLMRKTQRWPL